MNRIAWMLALAGGLMVPAPLHAQTPPCSPPKPGQYVVMERGVIGTEPTVRLIQESWMADGRINGVVVERTGQSFRRERYSGTYRVQSSCQVLVKRQHSSKNASVATILNPNGVPVYGLETESQTVISSRWFLQGTEICQSSDLNGVVLSRQQGLSWDGTSWLPNAVIQREVWDSGVVRGTAISSYNGRQEQASFVADHSRRQLHGATCDEHKNQKKTTTRTTAMTNLASAS